MKKNYRNLTLFTLFFLCFGVCSYAQQSINIVFNDTDHNDWSAYGDSYVVAGGHLNCNMALQTNSKYRGDFKFNNDNSADINFALNPSKDVYLAIKFIGTRPDGALKLEFNDGSQWFNSKWGGGSPSSIETVGGNYIYYFNLSVDEKYTGESVNVRRMNFIIADAAEEPYSYTIDWIATFASVEAIQAYKDTADDGEGDMDDYVVPAVLNQTTNAGYATLNAAVTAAAANDVLVLNENTVITSRINVDVPITVVACEAGASIIRGYTNGLVLLTKTGSVLTLGGSCGTLTLDGASLSSTSNFIEASNGATTTINSNVVIKNCYSTSTSGPAICNKSNGQLVLNGVTFDDCKTLDGVGEVIEDKGVVFVGTALTLIGDNKFNNCTGSNIFLEANTKITATDANHNTALKIMIQDPNTRTSKDVVLDYTDESKMTLMNAGYKLISDGTNLQFTTSTGIAGTVVNDEMSIVAQGGIIYINVVIPQAVAIYNASGMLVREVQLQAGDNAIDSLPKGFYIVNNKKVVL